MNAPAIRRSCIRAITALLFLLPSAASRAQSDIHLDSTNSKDFLWRTRHSPSRAALYSAILPGAGQAYNRKYWKIPIAWAGLGISYYFIRTNTNEYERYKDAYLAVIDDDPNTVDEFNGAYSATSILNVAETYRRWRDLSYISFGLIYVLNIMDAAVDGYFVRFDVNPDLSLGLGPSLPLAAQGAMGLSLSLRL